MLQDRVQMLERKPREKLFTARLPNVHALPRRATAVTGAMGGVLSTLTTCPRIH